MSSPQTSLSRSRYNLRPRKGRLASWQSLPTEIWSIIFYLALPDDWESSAALGRRRLKYAEVCRAWRSIAFATTPLWTSIVIDFTTLRHDLAMADLVGRTGQAPLHIKILGPGDSMRDAKSWSFWKQICALSRRWASLRIWVDNLETACKELGGEFPLLRSLSMWQGLGDTSFGNPLRFFGSAPNVSRLKIRWARASDRQTLPAVSLPSAWSLTHLDLNFGNCAFVDPQLSPLTVAVTAVTVCGDTLRSARFAWETDDSSPLTPLTEPVVTLPSLEDLELQREASGMLLIMAAPNLQKLLLGGKPAPKVSLIPFTYYGGLQPPEDPALSRLRTFLDRSDDCPRLRDLHLCRVQLDGALDCLRRLDSLVCLEIVSYVANEAGLSVVRGLVRDPTVPTSMALLPCLKVLTICHEESVKQRIVRRPFCAAVRSRRIPVTLGSSTLAIIETCHTHCSHTLLHGSFHMSDGDQGEYDMTVDRIDAGFDLRLP
ncbi:hypothetical protein EV714DRAFT_197675 [Schizophyllum commune]